MIFFIFSIISLFFVLKYILKKILKKLKARNKTNGFNLPFKKSSYYDSLINYLESHKNIIIISKGQVNIPSNILNNKNTLFIGIKQSILKLEKKDILVLNDYEGLFGLEKIIYQIKLIICPTRIHYKHEESIEANCKFLEYLKLHNFQGEILCYCKNIKDYNPDILFFRTTDSAQIIFNILEGLKIINKNINIYGLYSSFKEDEMINNQIKNSNIHFAYQDDYNSYLDRVINNKFNHNLKFLANLKTKKEIIKIENTQLFQNNSIVWN